MEQKELNKVRNHEMRDIDWNQLLAELMGCSVDELVLKEHDRI